MFQLILLSLTSLYQLVSIAQERHTKPPGERIDVGGYALHLYQKNQHSTIARPTIVLDHSLGGVEGYALIDALAKLGSVCIYDRAGYEIRLNYRDPIPPPMISETDQLWIDEILHSRLIP